MIQAPNQTSRELHPHDKNHKISTLVCLVGYTGIFWSTGVPNLIIVATPGLVTGINTGGNTRGNTRYIPYQTHPSRSTNPIKKTSHPYFARSQYVYTSRSYASMLRPRFTLFPVSISIALEGFIPKMPSSSATVTDMRADGAFSGDSSVRPP